MPGLARVGLVAPGRIAKDRAAGRAGQQAASIHQAEHLFSKIGKRESITSTSKHFQNIMLAGVILGIQAILSTSDARYPAATTVQPRFAQGRRIHFPSNLHIGEADGGAPV